MTTYIVISTCLTNELSCKLLLESVSSAHRFYKHILIVDDTPIDGIDIYQLQFNCKVIIIKNQFKKSGEITRIYYFWKYAKKGDIGILIHDSTIINGYINFNNINSIGFIPLFSIEHKWNNTKDEKSLISKYNELIQIYDNKDIWKGSFGVQYIVTWNFIDKVMYYYKDLFDELLEKIKTRTLRSCCERIIQVIFVSTIYKVISNQSKIIGNISIYGTIHDYTAKFLGKSFGVEYKDFDKYRYYCYKHMPIIKVWVGR